MSNIEEKPTYSSSSLLRKHSIGNVSLIETSRTVGWTSVLIEQHRVYPDDEPMETNRTPDQTIVVVTRGETTIEVYKAGMWRQANYRAGTVGLTPPWESDRLRRRAGTKRAPFELADVYVPRRFFEEAAEHYRHIGHRYQDIPLRALAFNDPLIAQTVGALVRAMCAAAPDLYAQTAIQWLSMHLLTAHTPWLDLHEDRRSLGTISDKRLAGVLEFMSAHFAEPITLEELAAEAGVSKFHFTKLFRRSTGATAHALLIDMRMAAARRMLTTTDRSVSEIAAACGFTRPEHFGTSFRKRFGLSPKAFRKMRGTADPLTS